MPEPKFQISLAAWSMHRMFFAKEIDQLGMVDLCHDVGIGGLELVNTFFPSPQYGYLKQLRKRADDAGVQILLIMCDAEGSMAGPEKASRMLAAQNHHKWIDIASVLGCHAIRCNTVIPGATETGILDAAEVLNPGLKAAVARTSPMNRLADPAETAAAVAFLASDECPFMTGAELLIDGGALSIHPGF